MFVIPQRLRATGWPDLAPGPVTSPVTSTLLDRPRLVVSDVEIIYKSTCREPADCGKVYVKRKASCARP